MRRGFRAILLSVALILALLAIWQQRVPPPPVALPPLTGQVDRVLIEKAARRLTVFRDGQPLRSYRVALGFAPDGAKTRQGDGRTPEGHFRIDRRNPDSAYHLSLGISYPRPEDLSRARRGGYSPGGDIFIHGQPNGRSGKPALANDWTAGCIAVTDPEIEELWRVVAKGTPVEIRP